MRAFVIQEGPTPLQLVAAEVPAPRLRVGEVLVRVLAAGVTPTELQWYPSTHMADGSPRANAIPGHEFSGLIEEVSPDDADFQVGDAVFGMNDWFEQGATAEFCAAPVNGILHKPSMLSFTEAAAMPISALTAWQALVVRAKVQQGDRVLILGAGGAVGLMAVQVAVQSGCTVIGSADEKQFEVLQQLGVRELLDYREANVADAGIVDVILDTVGGESLQRAKQLLRDGGRMVTIAADAEGSEDPLLKKAFFIVEPSSGQLAELCRWVEMHKLRVFVKSTFEFVHATEAYQQRYAGNGLGKLVLVSDSERLHDDR